MAEQLEFFAIPSPCIGVCQSGEKGYCKGCFRTRDERLYWTQINDDAKRQVIKACQRRKAAASRRRAANTETNQTQQELWPQQRDPS